MVGVGNIYRKHHAVCDIRHAVYRTFAKSLPYFLDDNGRQLGIRPLLAETADFLVVKKAYQIHPVCIPALDQAMHQRTDGSDVVKPRRTYKFARDTRLIGQLSVVDTQVIIQNVLFLKIESLCQQLSKRSFLVQFLPYSAKQRQKMLLVVDGHAFLIHFPVHMHCQIRQIQHRFLEIHQMAYRPVVTLPAGHHPAGQGKRPVKERIQNRSAVHFRI